MPSGYAFSVVDVAAFESLSEILSPRQLLMVLGACNFHALDVPGRRLSVRVYLGGSDDYPRLTDAYRRVAGDLARRRLLGGFEIQSTAQGEPHEHFAPNLHPLTLEDDTFERHLLISPDGSEKEATPPPPGLYWRLRSAFEHQFPFQYDLLRQVLLARRERRLRNNVIPRRGLTDVERNAGPVERSKGPRAVLFGLHWLDLGGAERWAVETVRLAKEAGYTPVVITDRLSHHPWLDRPEMEGAIVMCLTHPIDAAPGTEPFLRSLAENYNIRGVVVHHCAWLYDRLPLLRRYLPDVPVIDSLHIVEYAGGGYPATAVHLDRFIDVHHVISPHLRRWMTREQKVRSGKVELAPLVGLTMEAAVAETLKPRVSQRELVLGFVGRFARQKRPYLFLALLNALRRQGVPVRAVMHGSGELESSLRRWIRRRKLGDLVEIRSHDVAVAETLQQIDLLVLTSQNEGLTLTTLEAVAAGVPVLSSDVGSQSTLVVPEVLAPRAPHSFIPFAVDALRNLAASEQLRSTVWEGEMALVRDFSTLVDAETWTKGVLAQWNQ